MLGNGFKSGTDFDLERRYHIWAEFRVNDYGMEGTTSAALNGAVSRAPGTSSSRAVNIDFKLSM